MFEFVLISRISSGYDLLAVFVYRYGGVVVESLRHQLKRQRILLTARFFDLRSFILKPDLDLRFVQAQILRKLLSPSLGQISILREFPLQTRKLFGAESCPRPLLFRRATRRRTFHSPRTRSWKRTKELHINLRASCNRKARRKIRNMLGSLLVRKSSRQFVHCCDSAFLQRLESEWARTPWRSKRTFLGITISD